MICTNFWYSSPLRLNVKIRKTLISQKMKNDIFEHINKDNTKLKILHHASLKHHTHFSQFILME